MRLNRLAIGSLTSVSYCINLENISAAVMVEMRLGTAKIPQRQQRKAAAKILVGVTTSRPGSLCLGSLADLVDISNNRCWK